MAEPSDELVSQVSDFTGLDRHADRAMILAALKVCGLQAFWSNNNNPPPSPRVLC